MTIKCPNQKNRTRRRSPSHPPSLVSPTFSRAAPRLPGPLRWLRPTSQQATRLNGLHRSSGVLRGWVWSLSWNSAITVICTRMQRSIPSRICDIGMFPARCGIRFVQSQRLCGQHLGGRHDAVGGSGYSKDDLRDSDIFYHAWRWERDWRRQQHGKGINHIVALGSKSPSRDVLVSIALSPFLAFSRLLAFCTACLFKSSW